METTAATTAIVTTTAPVTTTSATTTTAATTTVTTTEATTTFLSETTPVTSETTTAATEDTTTETEPSNTSETTETTVTTAATEPQIVGPAAGYNFLTGLPVSDTSVNNRRPVAVVYNNIRLALPQPGISAADVVFEVEAEGGITRIVAVFSDISSVGTIGSIRSARPVMINISMGLDCVFVHSGGSPQAYDSLKTYGVLDVDGLYDNGTVFYRDANRQARMGLEHSLMTTGAKINRKISNLAKAGKRTTLTDLYRKPFSFNETNTVPNGAKQANKVTTRYGGYQPSFVYNASTGKYYRYQYGSAHVDGNTGAQLSFKNVVVLSVTSSVIPGDTSGRRQFNDVGTGTGIYATDGVYVPITWSKASASAPLKLTYANGTPLKLNPGKTFISYVNGDANIIIGR